MSKKLRRSLNEPKGIIITGKFAMESAKMYIITGLLMFHIIPLFFVFMGENGRMLLAQMFMFMLNPIFLFAVGFFYGIRNGFDWKYPLILTILSTISVPMYYDFADVNYAALSTALSFCVYGIFSYLSAVLGGFVKRFLI